jgi:peroxiredoxin (alkyl hydroperoxide reductase subunit C)
MKLGHVGRAVGTALTLGLMLAVAPANAALDPGNAAPVFTAPAALAGKTFTFSLDKALRKGPVVLYFFPEAFTDGCTLEAKTFADTLPKFKALGATVVGMSRDSMTVLKKFSVEACHSKFPVASDPSLETIRKYDAALWQGGDGKAGRITYIISPERKVIYAYASDSPDQHVEYALDALGKWRARNPMPPAKAARPQP